MLVLSRKVGETIKIGQDVEVTVVRVDRGKVRLAIQAPREVVIMRSELLNTAEGNEVHGAAVAR
jgi:carbon storage regulator